MLSTADTRNSEGEALSYYSYDKMVVRIKSDSSLRQTRSQSRHISAQLFLDRHELQRSENAPITPLCAYTTETALCATAKICLNVVISFSIPFKSKPNAMADIPPSAQRLTEGYQDSMYDVTIGRLSPEAERCE